MVVPRFFRCYSMIRQVENIICVEANAIQIDLCPSSRKGLSICKVNPAIEGTLCLESINLRPERLSLSRTRQVSALYSRKSQ